MRAAVLLGMALLLAVASVSAQEDLLYFVVQFPDENVPIIDGNLDEWEVLRGMPGYEIITEDLYEHKAGMGIAGAGVDPADFTAWLLVGWNERTNKLYVGCRTYDNVHVVTSASDADLLSDPTLMRLQDDFEIMIDIDDSGGQYWGFEGLTEEELKRRSGAQATGYAYAYPSQDGVHAVSFNAATWDVGVPYQEYAFDSDAGTTTYEIMLTPWMDFHWMGPEESIEGDLTQGEIIGLEFSYGDFDDPENPTKYHAFWTVSGQEETFTFADRFADFLLTPLDETIPWEPIHAVEENTWGRIKASFTY